MMKIKKSFYRGVFSIVAACCLLSFAVGCGKNRKDEKVDLIRIVHGNDQFAMPGEKFAEQVKVELLSPVQKGLLGGKGRRKTVANCPVVIKADNGLIVDGKDLKSDVAGVVEFSVKAADRTGDLYLTVVEPK